jgi:UDP-arabinose 4-epimerase
MVSMRVLITGGAGYIGSHTAKALARAGIEPIVYDNLSGGHRWAVKWGPLVEADLSDRITLKRTIQQYGITAALHFAAYAYVGQSMLEPRRYFQNNVINTFNLLDAFLEIGGGHIVFSSSCAVYGEPNAIPIGEDHFKLPISPYGESKLFIERVLESYGRAYDLRWAALRYFNAAGADPEQELGELHDPETHLLPLVIEAAMGKRDGVELFGVDYPTADGTAVRDYIHVSDLADAHVIALQKLLSGAESFSVNLGTGCGISGRQIVAAVERVVGTKVNVKPALRRPGDPPVLVADPTRAQSFLQWRPRHSSLENIVTTACRWHRHKFQSAAVGSSLQVPAVGLVAPLPIRARGPSSILKKAPPCVD